MTAVRDLSVKVLVEVSLIVKVGTTMEGVGISRLPNSALNRFV